MKILKLFNGKDGETHFKDTEIELKDGGPIGKLSELISATGVIFRETPADYDYDYHNAPARQFIVMLDAGLEITVASGKKRIVKAGEVILVEDTTGHGHISKALKNKPRKSIFIILD